MFKGPKWVFVNPPTSVRSSQEREFVYLLLLPERITNKQIPFYVGTTSQLHKRFGNHKEINWAAEAFQQPVPVLIVGTVLRDDAFRAVQHLSKILLKRRFSLAAHKPTKTPYLKTLDFTGLRKYAEQQTYELEELLAPWRKQWEIKTGNKQKPANKNITEPVAYNEEPRITREELIEACEGINFATRNERNFVLNIAYVYQTSHQYSKYWVSTLEVKWLKEQKNTKIRKIFQFPSNLSDKNYTYFRVQPSFIAKHSK